MDTIVLNVSHSQLEEQLKIAAACGVAEQNKKKNGDRKEGENIEIEVDLDEDNELTVDDANEGVHDHSMTSSSSDHDDRSSPDSLPPSTTSSTQQLLGDEFVKTLEKISEQQSSTLATAATTGSSAGAHTSHGAGNYRTELKRPDLKGTFRCSICQKIFCHSSSLSRHRMQAHFKSYTCTLCRKEITSNETLRAHMYKQHQISRMFMCRCCNWAFPDKTSLHMHMQAKEEGKTISVPVIGKGNPPTPQQHNQSNNHHTLNASSNQVVAHQLHNPHTAARPPAPTPSNNFFTPLQLHPLPAHQPLSITDPNALQTAAATLFPQMALLQGATSTPTTTSNSTGAQTDELMMKLRERLMLNNLMAQSGFGLAAWLAALPKVDQSGIGNLNSSNGDIMNGKEMSSVEMGEEEDEINVDKEMEEEEMPLERERQNDDDIHADDSDDGVNKRIDNESRSQLNDANESEENKNSENDERLRSLKKSTLDGLSSHSNGVSSPISNTMPNLRSAIATSPLNSLIYKKRLLHSPSTLNDTLLNIAANQATLPVSDQSSDGQNSHVSPAETHSSISPATESGRECYECSVYKGKLAVAENRCRYLEGRTATLQSDALRFSTRVSASESSARQFEQEGRLLREQNELLQRKLLECQEKTLAFMQGDQVTNPQAVAFYLNEILKATLLC